jgi:hypothetical protein
VRFPIEERESDVELADVPEGAREPTHLATQVRRLDVCGGAQGDRHGLAQPARRDTSLVHRSGIATARAPEMPPERADFTPDDARQIAPHRRGSMSRHSPISE